MTTNNPTDTSVAFFSLKGAQAMITSLPKPDSRRQTLLTASINDLHVVCKHTTDLQGVQVGVSYLCSDETFRVGENCSFGAALNAAYTAPSDDYAEYLALPVGSVIDVQGKFEDEPRYAPEFWELTMDGSCFELDDDLFEVVVTEGDIVRYPELADVNTVQLWSDDQGFVYAVAS